MNRRWTVRFCLRRFIVKYPPIYFTKMFRNRIGIVASNVLRSIVEITWESWIMITLPEDSDWTWISNKCRLAVTDDQNLASRHHSCRFAYLAPGIPTEYLTSESWPWNYSNDEADVNSIKYPGLTKIVKCRMDDSWFTSIQQKILHLSLRGNST